MADSVALSGFLKTYLSSLRDTQAAGLGGKELSLRTFLENLLRDFLKEIGNDSLIVTNEPKAMQIGKPDFEVRHGALATVGYIEAEAPDANLARLTGHAKHQNDLFKANLPNFLLTNHYDWALYAAGDKVAEARLTPANSSGAVTVHPDEVQRFSDLLGRFIDAATPAATTPQAIAKQLARRARLLKDASLRILNDETGTAVHSAHAAYRAALTEDIDNEKFADVYAQTFVYGLFLAWLSSEGEGFTRMSGIAALPRAVPPIRAMLAYEAFDFPEGLAWIVDGLCADLSRCDRETIRREFHRAGQDPMIHFYEPFLAAYDPKLRESRGSYYTPDAVVDFLVRAVDDLLVSEFGKKQGLADDSVRLLDPATGTATFLARAYRQVHERVSKKNAGMWPNTAREHLAEHFFGFELMPAAYTIAHLKLRTLLGELGAPLPDSQRLPVYLCNTLDEGNPPQSSLALVKELSEEIVEAGKVKKTEKILVVIGNPPYFGHSSNPSDEEFEVLAGQTYQTHDDRGAVVSKVATRNGRHKRYTHIGQLLRPYFFVDGAPLGERNPKWLQDDYVKFLRFSEDMIARSGSGIVAFVTNHGYLDNPTFRGMRRHLMQTFDELYVLDLHGNANKKETAPDGSEDKNVFDIKQGVAICLLVKRPKPVSVNMTGGGTTGSTVFHGELYGTRESKNDALEASSMGNFAWKEISPTAPMYFFVPQSEKLKAEYEIGWSLPEIFPLNGVGMTTARDNFVISFDRNTVIENAKKFRDATGTEAQIANYCGISLKEGWDLLKAQQNLQRESNLEKFVHQVSYRPFDSRYIFYHDSLIWRTVYKIMHNMYDNNFAIVSARSNKSSDMNHFYCTKHMMETKYGESTTQSALFPVWVYPTSDNLFQSVISRTANLSETFVAELSTCIGPIATTDAEIENGPKGIVTPEDVLHYAYGIFHSPSYRTRYAEFLKRDFPRLPLPPDRHAFDTAAAVGKKLVALHLLEDPALDDSDVTYPIAGNNEVTKVRVRYDAAEQRVYINPNQYFGEVPEDAYRHKIGGYQPAQKWLDDRAGRTLTNDDITHYQKMIAAMHETIRLQAEYDTAFWKVVPTAREDAPGVLEPEPSA